MKVEIDVKDNKLKFLLELLSSFSFVSNVKTMPNDELSVSEAQQNEVKQREYLVDSGQMAVRSWNEAKEDIFRKK